MDPKIVNAELDKLLAPNPEETLGLSIDAGKFEVVLTAIQPLAVSCTSVTLTSVKLAAKSAAQLKGVAAALSSRLNYLLEPILPIESDAEGAAVQMRSVPPQKDDDGTTYYELFVRRAKDDGTLCLKRFRKPKDKELSRTAIAANLTREQLTRVLKDFEEAVA